MEAVMKINESKALSSIGSGAGSHAETASVSPAASVSSAAQQLDKVSVVGEAEVLAAINSVRASHPQRVRSVGQNVEGAAYQANSSQLARRILEEAELTARLRLLLK